MESGADPAAQDINGNTALHYIARRAPMQNSESLLDMLTASASTIIVQAKAVGTHIINMGDNNGTTPLIALVRYSSPFSSNLRAVSQFTELFLEYGADPFGVDHVGGSAACYAAFQGLRDLLSQIVQLLPQTSFRKQQQYLKSLSDIISCVVLSPAYELNFQPDGILVILQHAGFNVFKHHVDLFANAWNLEPVDAHQRQWNVLETNLLHENKRFQLHHVPDIQALMNSYRTLEESVKPTRQPLSQSM
jgi:ankyrin repeat protein